MKTKTLLFKVASESSPLNHKELCSWSDEMSMDVPTFLIEKNPAVRDLLYPLTPEEFASQYHNKRHYLWEKAKLDASAFFSEDTLARLMSSPTVRASHIRFFRQTHRDEKNVQSISLSEMANGFHHEGASIGCDHLQSLIPAVSSLSRALSMAFGCQVTVNSYYTPGGAKTLKTHWDDHDVFMWQVSGSKRWRIHAPRVRFPLTEMIEEPSGIPEAEFTLKPGSMVYLPAGTYHSGAACEEGSLHVTIALVTYRAADHFLNRAQQALDAMKRDVEFRYPLPFRSVQGDEYVENLLEHLKSKFLDLLDLSGWKADASARIGGSPWNDGLGTWRTFQRIREMAPDTGFSVVESFRYFDFEQFSDHAVLFSNSYGLAVPKEWVTGIERLLSSKRFCFDSLGEGSPIGWDDYVQLVQSLATMGIVILETEDFQQSTTAEAA